MKSLNVFLDEKTKHKKPVQQPPALLTLRRKYIRQFPDIGQVAVYYSPQLKRHVTIPFTDIQWDAELKEEELMLVEDNVSILSKIVDGGKSQNLEFEDGTDMIVDQGTANSILSVYARANGGNKKKMAEMMSKDIKSFQKLVQFCLQNS